MARMQAGIQLKNHLYSKDYDIRIQFQQRWLGFPNQLRDYIKSNVRALAKTNFHCDYGMKCVNSDVFYCYHFYFH